MLTMMTTAMVMGDVDDDDDDDDDDITHNQSLHQFL